MVRATGLFTSRTYSALAVTTLVRTALWVWAELESMRRSVAIGGTLTRRDVEALLDTCELLLVPAWADARAALNRLHAALRASCRPAADRDRRTRLRLPSPVWRDERIAVALAKGRPVAGRRRARIPPA